jgi:hypothetical protein
MVASAITIIVVTAAASTLAMGFRFIAERKLRATAEMVCQSHMELLLAIESTRPLGPPDCAPVRYTRAVLGDDDVSAVFTATCTLDPNTPVTPERRYQRLTAHIRATIDGRPIQTSFVTYVMAP